eukprot:gb/GEZN01023562.1/.p1 GENE.gb/GEZN01023562.1/~~gb/GEZN01023562.1/.p1  ORF type:complete len:124 (-),score=11.96 gb/GEZN01023562.1/:220-546(-)
MTQASSHGFTTGSTSSGKAVNVVFHSDLLPAPRKNKVMPPRGDAADTAKACTPRSHKVSWSAKLANTNKSTEQTGNLPTKLKPTKLRKRHSSSFVWSRLPSLKLGGSV